MEEAKPADSWDLIIDPNLKHNVLAPGWKQYLELHASGRWVAQETGSAGSPGDTFPEETETWRTHVLRVSFAVRPL